MSANQPSKNERAAREWLDDNFAHSRPGPPQRLTASLAALLDRTEAEARADVQHEVFGPDGPAKRLVASEAQVAELKRLLEMTERDNDHFDDWVERAKKAESALAASRIEAARLREALHGLLSYMGADDEDATRQELACRAASEALASTSESAAAWLAEVQRKALERAADECHRVAARAEEYGDPHTAVRAADCCESAVRSLIPEPKEPTPGARAGEGGARE